MYVNYPATDVTDFEKYLIDEYFRLGSINKVFQEHRYDLPISFAGYDRLLTKYGVVKSAGPNSKLSESLYILKLMADYKTSLEKIYHQYAPVSVRISTNTLHRILHYMRLGLTRRQGTALLVSPKNNPNKILLGNDISLNNSVLGNRGDLSLPMGHSKTGEPIKDAIARVLQNEVFTKKVVSGFFPWEVVPKHAKPCMYITIADIQVAVYKIFIPSNNSVFSSHKLKNLQYYDIDNLPPGDYRPGVMEIIKHSRDGNLAENKGKTLSFTADLNKTIFALAKDPIE